MKAVIPVAGMGTRLRPHTHTTPKALMHVAGRPIVAHILDELVAAGVDEVVLVVGYLGELIEAYVTEHYARLRLHFVPQGEPLGNGHAVYAAREHLDGGPVLVIFGDTIIKGDLTGLARSKHSALVCSDYSASQAGRRRSSNVFPAFARIREQPCAGLRRGRMI